MAAIGGSKRPRIEDDEINPICENDPISGTDSVSEAKINLEPLHLPPYDTEATRRYYQQSRESEGFDVDHYPTIKLLGGIAPIRKMDNKTKADLEECCRAAIRKYHKDDKDTNFEFVELVKANRQIVSGIMYYITFKARDTSNGIHVILQAKVRRDLAENEIVHFCRIKPTK